MKEKISNRIRRLKICQRVWLENGSWDNGNDIKEKREFEGYGDKKKKIKPVTPCTNICCSHKRNDSTLDNPPFNPSPGFTTDPKPQ